jgi:hypothetical protein
MNSFTAHILFNLPTVLPTGKERTHRMGGKWVDETAKAPRMIDSKVSAAAIERVFVAVQAGMRTTNEIGDRMLMSVTVVQRALIVLEDWPGGPRVRRIKSFPAHQFEVIE